MKDSGVEWIGEVPTAWKTSKIKHHFKIGSGTTPKSDDPTLWDGEIIWITPADFKTDDVYVNHGHRNLSDMGFSGSSLEMIPAGNIIFSKRAPIGQVVINSVDLCTNQGCLTAIPRDASEVRFYRYLMSIATEEFELAGSGTTFKEISASSFGNIIFPLTDVAEQKRIADYLDTKCSKIDAIIARQEEIIEKLKEYKLSVITEAVTKGLNPDVEIKDSGINLIEAIPSHWMSVKVKRHLTLLTDYDANGSFADIAANVNVNTGKPYAWMVRATDLENKNYGISTKTNYCDEGTYNYLRKSKIVSGDLIVAKRGGIGNVYVVPDMDCRMTLAPNTYLMRFDDELLEKFMYYIFKSKYGQESLQLLNKSTTIGAVYKDDIKNLKIVIPAIQEQETIVKYLDSINKAIDSKITKIEKIVEKFKQYKKSLIYEVVTGKKEV